LPIDFRLCAIDLLVPGLRLALECGQLWNSAHAQAFAREQADLDFRLVRPLCRGSSPASLVSSKRFFQRETVGAVVCRGIMIWL
jgi:hypothetical protein